MNRLPVETQAYLVLLYTSNGDPPMYLSCNTCEKKAALHHIVTSYKLPFRTVYILSTVCCPVYIPIYAEPEYIQAVTYTTFLYPVELEYV